MSEGSMRQNRVRSEQRTGYMASGAGRASVKKRAPIVGRAKDGMKVDRCGAGRDTGRVCILPRETSCADVYSLSGRHKTSRQRKTPRPRRRRGWQIHRKYLRHRAYETRNGVRTKPCRPGRKPAEGAGETGEPVIYGSNHTSCPIQKPGGYTRMQRRS